MKHLALIALILLNLTAWAADEDDKDKEKDDAPETEISDILSSVGYPELQVVPRATERLNMEAKAERGSWFITHWPIELSGLMTAYVGNNSKNVRRTDLSEKEKTDGQTLSTITTTVGAGWVVGGLILGLQKPYTGGARSVARVKGKDQRSELLRERLAEEALERPAKTMRVLQWVSILTNAGLNAALIQYSTDKGKVTAGLGLVFAFLPVMFTDHSIDVYEKHLEYKKKIYAPLKTGGMHYDPSTKTFTPTMNLVWNF
ncbi:MAG: hypothetical protein KF799_05620 [Bdellovibrionales bacterium]|nr:hypothetical protein [Bdellovibrionales bacterium]